VTERYRRAVCLVPARGDGELAAASRELEQPVRDSGRMTNPRPYIIALAAVFTAVSWYMFRPELLFIDRVVNDAAPMVSSEMPATMLASGSFTSDAHETVGTAAIHRTADGRAVLRLAAFRTSNGPDVRVYLVASEQVTDSRAVKDAEVLDLGALKGNIGDQNYAIPMGTDLTRYRSVSIWCRRFSVNFGAASLR
jgi:hypothetical protein